MKNFKRILKYLKPHRLKLTAVIILAFISVAFTLLGPVLTGEGIDRIIGKGNVDFKGMAFILIGFAVTIIVGGLAQKLLGNAVNGIAYKAAAKMREDAFSKITRLPLRRIDAHPHGDLISRVVGDIDTVTEGFLQAFNQLFTGVITIAGTIIIMFFINYVIAIVVIILTPLSVFVAVYLSKKSYKLFKKNASIQGEITAYINEHILNQKLITAYSFEEESNKGFREINSRMYTVGQKSQFYSSLTHPLTRFVNGIVYAVVGLLGAYFCLKGGFWGAALTIGQLSVFLNYANQYGRPFNEITAVVTQLQNAFASSERLFELMDWEDERNPETAEEWFGAEGNITAENVSFSYIREKKLIEDFNLEIKKGAKVAIVGPTGCGKTTLVNLLMRFYETDGGRILLDGRDIKDATLESYRKLFGMVLQDSWLFEGTVAENIAYGREDVPREEIIDAAKGAYADSFIKNLPKGYDTHLTEGGGMLSHGEMQLLCIARMMLTNPPILILDEATSNIDTMTEIKIQKAFKKLMEGRTIFIIAHRLSTIRDCDLILVMKKGNVIEQGSHEELMLKEGFYKKLFDSQFAE